MKNLRDIVTTSGVSYGARVADESEERDASPLRHADELALNWAANYWPQADADDFDWALGGMRVRHRETGEILRIRLGHPMPGGELQSDIQFFCVRDGRLVLLGKPGSERPTTAVLGTVTGRKLSNDWAPPDEGQIW